MISNAQAAEFCLLVEYAADMHESDRESLSPAPDPRLSPKWKE